MARNPPVPDDEIVRTLKRLYRAGECDSADGGVPSCAIAEELGVTNSPINRRLKHDDRARSVWGIGPNGPRPSWIPLVECERASATSHAEGDL
ncbi:hypothetical protein ELS19_04470 [Halogeometricum borinquense]|uniref:Uncharacterized protein n=1 Tax=Halogeometricum borinquense TaxID=60847 RepID=A0A482TH92_9EURY|nr:hypothetical protein [Halogeometricum borinquense]RYJ13293.1 hypothetical protein ELS19_04470 [Halogeometricum borinquense]